MNNEDFLIMCENMGYGKLITVFIFEDHWSHIKNHIFFIWKPRVFMHVIRHVRYWFLKRKLGIPTITLDDLIKKHMK